MATISRLLLGGLLGLVLLAPPAYSQDTKTQLNLLMTDTINLKNSIKQLQDSNDQKNAEIKSLLQDVLNRFTTIEANVQRMSETLAAMKATEDKSARDIAETRAAFDTLKSNVATFGEGVQGMQNQIRGLNTKLNDLNTKEVSLPNPADAFNRALGDYNAGIYELAISGFKEFLSSYPANERAGAAQFYIGDALMAQKKYGEAVTEFDKVLAMPNNGDKKCSALYRKGQALVAQKQNQQATTALNSVVKECPGTTEAENAARDLKTMPRPARGN
jgi:tol-pal system protein YbgF